MLMGALTSFLPCTKSGGEQNKNILEGADFCQSFTLLKFCLKSANILVYLQI